MAESQQDGGAPRITAPRPSQPKEASASVPAVSTRRAKVYLDRSQDFSTVHGEIPQGERHFGVMGFQNGLPFNHQDELMYDHLDVQENPKLLARADRLIARAEKYLATAKSKKVVTEDDDEEGEEIDGEEGEEGVGPVNLNAWARGIADWPWQEVSNYIARKYSKRVVDKRAAAELCLAEHVVTRAQLSKSLLRLVDS